MNITCIQFINWRMKNYTIYICIGLLVILFSLPFIFTEKDDQSKPLKKDINTNSALVIPTFITIASTGEKIDFETYVMGVVAAEMPASFSEEALKAQAVAARTYAIHKTNNLLNPIETTTAHQVYFPVNNLTSEYRDKIKAAVEATRSLVLIKDGKPISAMFHASSNGFTESALNYGGKEVSYLQSVPSPEEKLTKHHFSISELNHLLKRQLTVEQITQANIIRNDTNRISEITIGVKTWSGRDFRDLLSLASTDFNIQIIEGVVEIVASGYGHGVGMSQVGAQELALEGYTFEEILHHYYSGVTIEKFVEQKNESAQGNTLNDKLIQ